jgi:hypothetical protein
MREVFHGILLYFCITLLATLCTVEINQHRVVEHSNQCDGGGIGGNNYSKE